MLNHEIFNFLLQFLRFLSLKAWQLLGLILILYSIISLISYVIRLIKYGIDFDLDKSITIRIYGKMQALIFATFICSLTHNILLIISNMPVRNTIIYTIILLVETIYFHKEYKELVFKQLYQKIAFGE